MLHERRQRKPSLLACLGGLFAAVAVALSAYAAHAGIDAVSQSRLQLAALYAFGHGIALAALAPGTTRWLGRAGLVLLLLGMLLFSGSLALNALAGTVTRLAPVGGMGLIAGWLLWSIDAIRR